MSRRFFWFALIVVAAIGAYTAGWYWLAGQVEGRVTGAIATLNRAGDRASCDRLDVRGYPFRIGVFCEATYVENRGAGASFATGAFRSAAQVYNPFHLVAEADGPGRLVLPGMVPLDLHWTSLASSLRLAQPLPERLSLEAKGLQASTADMNLLNADDFQLHMRPAGSDLDIASRFTGLALDPAVTGGAAAPKLDGVIDVSVKDGVARLAQGRADMRDMTAAVRGIRLSFGSGAAMAALSLAGTATTTAEGLVNADLTLSAENPAALGDQLAAAFPQLARQIRAGVGALAALGSNPSLPLTIRDGQVQIAFFVLGTLPPLD